MKAKIVYELSAFTSKQWPDTLLAEVILLGRSNAGKSSFINALAGSKLAKVSQAPGKTRSLNFFMVNDHYRLVDVPGYGWASRGGDEMRFWQNLVENYLHEREWLVGGILVMDARRGWAEDEKMLRNWFARQNLPLAVVLNKIDKISSKDVKRSCEIVSKQAMAQAFATDSISGRGVDEVEKMVYFQWVQPFNKTHGVR